MGLLDVALGIGTGGAYTVGKAAAKELGVGKESGLLGTGIGASKPKPIEPKYLEFDKGDFRNPALDYRGDVLKGFRAPARRAPQMGAAAPISGATVDTRQLDQMGIDMNQRGYQQGLGMAGTAARGAAGLQAGQQQYGLGLMRAAAEGMAPSAAQLQLQSGLQQGLAQQAAMAASARGGAGAQALARGQAAQQGAALAAQTNQQNAILRAQEMAQARGAYQGAIGEAIGQQQAAQQLGLSQAQLGLGQRAQDIGVGMDLRGQELQMALANAGYGQQAALQNQQMAQQAAIQNQQAALQTQAVQDQYRLGLLGQLGAIDTSTMQGMQEYNRLLNQQNIALQGGLMQQQGPILNAYGQNQAATLGAISSIAGVAGLPGGLGVPTA